jgi:hypothetical protein
MCKVISNLEYVHRNKGSVPFLGGPKKKDYG